jgi:uncharacterized phiE125 gp8 family phage protein
MRLTRTVAPEHLPISMAEARAYARVDEGDDALLASYVRSATDQVEQSLGLALITSTWEYSPHEFLFSHCTTAVRLPISPVQSVSQITYLDTLGDSQVLNSERYTVYGLGDVARIGIASGQTWPSMDHRHEVLTVTFVAGFGSDWNAVPQPIRQAIGELVRSYYDGCASGMVEELLMPWRPWPV